MKHVPAADVATITKSMEHAALLHRLLRMVLLDQPLETLLGEALDELVAVSWLSLLPMAGIVSVGENGTAPRLLAQRNLGPQITALCARGAIGLCLNGIAARQARTEHARCTDARPGTQFEGIGPHGHYAVPITARGETLGMLVVYLPEGHDRDEREVQFLGSYADLLALLITAKQREHAIVSTREQLQEALAETDGLMRTIRQHTIFTQTARNGRITDVNAAFCAISGYCREELLGAPHSVINSGHHPPEFWHEVWSTIAAGEAWRGEICNRRKDGVLYWVDSIIMPLSDGEGRIVRYLSVRIDITERKLAEEALGRMGRILDNSSNEIYVFDARTLTFVQVNRGARQNLGYSAEEVAALTPVDIKPDHTRQSFAKLITPLLSGETDMLAFETRHQRKDGSHYPVMVNLHYAAEETPPVFVAIIQDITDRRANQERIEQLAYYDPLTGLANRTLMIDRLRTAVARAARARSRVHLLFLDLNRFKEINDTRGHSVGDRVLVEVANRFQSVLRDSETLARIGGDEFVVILENTSQDGARAAIERLGKQLSHPIVIDGKGHLLGVSIGVACYPDDSRTPDGLLQLSDIAMYEAKVSGGGCCFYTHRMGRAIARRHEIAERLAEAFLEGALELHYQPIVDLHSGALRAAEALLRWHDPEWGWVAAGDFIPIAEERRMMSDLGAWVIDRACRQLRDWTDAGFAGPERLAINIAAQQIEDNSLLEAVRRATADHGVSPSALEAEITESSMMNDPERAAAILRQLKEAGLALSIDDFGTGYSSLAYLKQFATDKLKVDMSFVHDLLDDPNCQAIVTATIAMARGLGLTVLAEGVESEEQARRLRELGCDEAQGFHFGRPMPPGAFAAAWLAPAHRNPR